ncbi:MAG: polysulfide reductase NrfD [Chitinophagaceae bacterium]|nr:polysulfide reductase NrfD [Chitinophagaceae bacterium]MBL0335873.1 polysulfide reductase NrfD [Chitinophagaceae bacterium]
MLANAHLGPDYHALSDQEKREHREEIRAVALRPLRHISLGGKLWIAGLVLVLLLGGFAYYLQLKHGLKVTAMRDYASWGLYISNFVFFVAISLVGALISSVLRLTNFELYRPITRIAEIIAVSAIMFAGLIIIVDMGRPDRILNLFTHGRIQSPIVWDVIVVTTYLVTSVLFLYVPLLPGIALCRDVLTEKPKWQRWMYKFLALGWKGTENQWHIMKRSISIICVLIIPLAISIHTVTAWLFATTLRPGWDSTNFGPYFVAGAFQAGTACVIIAMFVFRKAYKLQKYLTEDHFNFMGKLLVFLCLVYAYFNINEYLVPAYKMRGAEGKLLNDLFTGHFAPLYWGVQIFGMALPAVLLLWKKARKPLPIFMIALFVVVAAWFKRYLIVTPIMLHPYLPIQDVPANWAVYFPTWIEMAIVGGSLAGVMLIITVFSKFFPIISIWETLENEGIELEELDNPKTEEHAK